MCTLSRDSMSACGGRERVPDNIPQNVSLTILGMQAALTDPGSLRHKEEFRELIHRVDVYCDSDESLWAALTSGYFLDEDFDLLSTPYDILPWWTLKHTLPTVDSVLQDWDEACRKSVIRRLQCEEGNKEVGISYQKLCRHDADIEEGYEICQKALEHIADTTSELEVFRAELGLLFYGTASIL